jgi:hypothetical protein
MSTVLGLIGIVAFVAGVIALAAGVTWLVVRLFPATTGGASAKPTSTPDSSSGSSSN